MALEVEIKMQLVDFSLEAAFATRGRPLGILGASGAGKSMTLRAIAGIATPSRGRITVDGRVLFDSERAINVPSRERRVGLLFQNYALFPHLTVGQNVAFGLRGMEQREQARRASQQLAAVHLSGFERRHPATLSGGEQQRVALARALAPQPAALLLDEPFSALDTHLRGQVERQLRETLTGYEGAALLAGHNLEEIYRLCGDLVVIDKGRVIASGSREEIFRYPPDRRTAELTGCKNFSRARATGDRRVEALDWGCSLRMANTMPSRPGQLAIRAHHVDVAVGLGQGAATLFADNTFPVWLADSTEGPFRVTLYLRLQGPSASPADYHLQAEVTRAKWLELQVAPCPWQVRLEPDLLILLPS